MHNEYINYGSESVKLHEELAEVIIEAAKIQKIMCKGERFGYDDHHPDRPPEETNRKRIKKTMGKFRDEVKDVERAMNIFESYLNKLPFEVKRVPLPGSDIPVDIT
jgi:hypothetical protein